MLTAEKVRPPGRLSQAREGGIGSFLSLLIVLGLVNRDETVDAFGLAIRTVPHA